MDEIRTINLTWERFAARKVVSRELLANVDAKVWDDYVWNMLVAQLEKYLLVDTFADDTYTAELKTPANWWEHWKQDHGLKWLGPLIMQRWPVRTVTHTAVVRVSRSLAYPEAKLARDPGGLGTVRILERTRGAYWLPDADR